VLRSDRTYGHKEASVPWEQHRLYDVGSFVSIEADCLWGGVTKPLDARPPHMVVFRLQWQYTVAPRSIHTSGVRSFAKCPSRHFQLGQKVLPLPACRSLLPYLHSLD